MSATSGTRHLLDATDSVTIAVEERAPAGGGTAADADAFAVVMAPGFSGWAGKPAVARVAVELGRALPEAGFFLVDARGHGRSSGVSTLGDREVFDIDAAIGLARRAGFRRVLTLGWSMGGTSVLRQAALTAGSLYGWPVTERPDAVATVSAASRFDDHDTAAMRRLQRIALTRSGRLVARHVMHVRIDPAGWTAPPLTPAEAAGAFDLPLLVVHGDRDHYFGPEHGHVIAAAHPGSRAWIVAGLGHAEDAAVRPDVPGFLDQLAVALRSLVAAGAERRTT